MTINDLGPSTRNQAPVTIINYFRLLFVFLSNLYYFNTINYFTLGNYVNLSEYIQNLNRHFKSGISSEHTYRSDLQILIQAMTPDLLVTNEPRRIACGAPDYIISRKGIPVGYIEAKDIGADLKDKTYTEQFERYKASFFSGTSD